MHFSFQAAFALGWRCFCAHIGALLGAAVVFLLAQFAVSLLVGGVLAALLHTTPDIAREPGAPGIAFLLLNNSQQLLIGALFQTPLAAGLGLLVLRHLRGESPGLAVLFSGFSERYAPLVGIGVLVAIPFLASAALFGVTGPSPLLLLLIPVFVWLSIRFGFITLLCMDPRRRLGVSESFAGSWRLTGPAAVFWPLLGILLALLLLFALSSGLIALALFALGVPTLLIFAPNFALLFLLLPFALAVSAAAYELIAGAESRGAP